MAEHAPMEIQEIEFKEDKAMVECVDGIMNKYDISNNGYLDRDECMQFLEDYLNEQMDEQTYDERE